MSTHEHESFVGPEVTIKAEAVERFCAVVGNDSKSFKAMRNDILKVLMNFAIVTGWKASLSYDSIVLDIDLCTQAIMKSIFPSVIDGDLLKLVHLSNQFHMVEGATSLQAEARIVSVTNANEGKIIKVKGHAMYHGNQPAIGVISTFLYHGPLPITSMRTTSHFLLQGIIFFLHTFNSIILSVASFSLGHVFSSTTITKFILNLL